MKKTLSLLLSLAMVFSLASCGKKPTSGESGLSKPTSSETSSKPTDSSKPADSSKPTESSKPAVPDGKTADSGETGDFTAIKVDPSKRVSDLEITKLKTDKKTYNLTHNEAFDVVVDFAYTGTPADDAWICIVPADVPHGDEMVNDEYDLHFFYIANCPEGQFVFEKLTLSPGKYTLRVNENDNGGAELAWCEFTVEAKELSTVQKDGFTMINVEPSKRVSNLEITKLKTDKTHYVVSNYEPFSITVDIDWNGEYAHNAWVCIVSADVLHGSEERNEEYNRYWFYLSDVVDGSFTFDEVTLDPGNYSLRVNDSDDGGAELAWCEFTVDDGRLLSSTEKDGFVQLNIDPAYLVSDLEVTKLKTDKSSYTLSDDGQVTIAVDLAYTGTPADDAWVCITPTNILHGSEEVNDYYNLHFFYLHDLVDGKYVFENVIVDPGNYQLRVNDSDENGSELAWCEFSVKRADSTTEENKPSSSDSSSSPAAETSVPPAEAGDGMYVNQGAVLTYPTDQYQESWIGGIEKIDGETPHIRISISAASLEEEKALCQENNGSSSDYSLTELTVGGHKAYKCIYSDSAAYFMDTIIDTSFINDEFWSSIIIRVDAQKSASDLSVFDDETLWNIINSFYFDSSKKYSF